MQSIKLCSYSTLLFGIIMLIPNLALSKRILVSVFYQSYGDDSLTFIRDKVYPLYQNLSKQVQIDLVPYGNANTTILPNGTVTFSCQYGPKACYANMLHACAVTHLEPEDAISFINCTMSDKVPGSAGFPCAKSHNLDVQNVYHCVQSQEGNLLLAANGARTKQQNYKIHAYHGWKPTINFNNNYFKDARDANFDKLLETTKKILKSTLKSCKKRTGNE